MCGRSLALPNTARVDLVYLEAFIYLYYRAGVGQWLHPILIVLSIFLVPKTYKELSAQGTASVWAWCGLLKYWGHAWGLGVWYVSQEPTDMHRSSREDGRAPLDLLLQRSTWLL